MNNLIQNITIENFKSIKKLEMKNCARINLIIGKPNVGKSNIIEALSVFSLPYSSYLNYQLGNHIRIEEEPQLFYQGNANRKAEIIAGENSSIISFDKDRGLEIEIRDNQNRLCQLRIDQKKRIRREAIDKNFETSIKRYIFKPLVGSYKINTKFLYPPYGINLVSVLERNEELKETAKRWFKEYNLRLIFDKGTKTTLRIFKDFGGDDIFTLPYSSIADTLQRMLFYKAAIVSNTNSVLLFEEPEAHAFPPYISKITHEVITSETNQFFITTHSPYVLNDFLEKRELSLAIYLVNYKDNETIIKRLTEIEQNKVYEYGIDVFFNNEYFWE